jgi:hypothetical protein
VQDATKTFLEKRLMWPVSQEEIDVLRDGLILNESTGFTHWQNPIHTDGPKMRLEYVAGRLIDVSKIQPHKFQDSISSIRSRPVM